MTIGALPEPFLFYANATHRNPSLRRAHVERRIRNRCFVQSMKDLVLASRPVEAGHHDHGEIRPADTARNCRVVRQISGAVELRIDRIVSKTVISDDRIPDTQRHEIVFGGFLISEHFIPSNERVSRIKNRLTARHSPWQNGHVERLIGSIHRECIDHLIVFNEAHLRRIMKRYAAY